MTLLDGVMWAVSKFFFSAKSVHSEHHTPDMFEYSPSVHITQSKQQKGFPFWETFRIPGAQVSLQTEYGIWNEEEKKIPNQGFL